MTRRERVYRMLLAGYPAPFRDEHAESMLATLLDGATDRGATGELRELGGLVGGGLRARGEMARRAGRGEWRHGVAMLLVPLTAVNLAVIAAAFWAVRHVPGLGVQGVGTWWIAATFAAGALVVAVATQRRPLAIAAAVMGLIPLGYDEWLQAVGSGHLDHLSIAAQRGFDGPPMSPFWLFLAVVILVAALAGRFDAPSGQTSRRLSALVGGAIAVAVAIPTSLHLLLALALIGTVACPVLGAWDRRLHGTGLALWIITLPYVFWWFSVSYPMHPGWLLPYLGLLPLTITVAWVSRRRRRLLA